MGYQSTVLIGVPFAWSAESSLEPVSNSVQYSLLRGGIGHRLILLRRFNGSVRVVFIGFCLSLSREHSRQRTGESVRRSLFGNRIIPRFFLLRTSGPVPVRQEGIRFTLGHPTYGAEGK